MASCTWKHEPSRRRPVTLDILCNLLKYGYALISYKIL
jgi:hypothetical protein